MSQLHHQRALDNTPGSVRYRGFTIVELLIVIVIIGILAAITIIAYSGVTDRAHAAALQSDLANSVKKIAMYNTDNSRYPVSQSDIGVTATSGETFSYNTDTNGTVYCLAASGWNQSYYVTQDATTPSTGSCSGTTGTPSGGGSPTTIYYPSATLTTVGPGYQDSYSCVSLGMTFGTHSAVTVTGLRWYAPVAGGTSAFTAVLADNSNESTVLASGSLSGSNVAVGWNTITFTSPYVTMSGVTYDAKVVQSGSSVVNYTAKSNSFPVVQEPLYQADSNRGGYAYTCSTTDPLNVNTTWYGIDVIAHQ